MSINLAHMTAVFSKLLYQVRRDVILKFAFFTFLKILRVHTELSQYLCIATKVPKKLSSVSIY